MAASVEAIARAERIRNATLKARKEWLAYDAAQQAAILRLFQEQSRVISDRIRAFVKAGKIPPERLAKTLDQLNEITRKTRASYSALIKRSMSNSVDMGIGSSMKGVMAGGFDRIKAELGTAYVDKDGNVHKWNPGVQDWRDSRWYAINTDAMDFLFRYRPTGLTFADSVWQSTLPVENAIRNAINTGVLLGKPVETVALQIQRFVSPTSKTNKMYAARRLARTEMKRAYKEGQIRYAMDKNWIEGGIWRLGNLDACEFCVQLADKWYAKDDMPGDPHPNCLCWIQWHNELDDLPDGVSKAKPPAGNVQLPARSKTI